MPRSAANQQRDLALGPRRGADGTMRNRRHAVGMGRAETRQRGRGELIRLVKQLGHVRIVLPDRMRLI